MISTTVTQTPLKYVRASLHTPIDVFVAVADTVFETEKLTDCDLDPVADDEATLVPDTDADSDRLIVNDADSDLEVVADNDGLLESVVSADTDADSDRLFVTDADSDRLVVTDADSDLLFVLESDSDLEIVRDGETLLESVGSAELDADILRLSVVLAVVVASMDSEAVVDGVKLGETGLFVTDGVNDGEGINSV